MSANQFRCRLTAILSADPERGRRLLGEGEATTAKTLAAYKQVIFSLVKQHGAQVVDLPGDNILAEFSCMVSRNGHPTRH